MNYYLKIRYPKVVQWAREQGAVIFFADDIDFVRERLNLPIAYNGDRGGYHFTQPISSFPTVELTEAELVSVFIGQKALAQYKGTPFEPPLRSAFDKLTSNLTGRLTMAWSDLDALVSFKSFGLFHVMPDVSLAPLEELFQARVITFLVKKGLLPPERARMLRG